MPYTLPAYSSLQYVKPQVTLHIPPGLLPPTPTPSTPAPTSTPAPQPTIQYVSYPVIQPRQEPTIVQAAPQPATLQIDPTLILLLIGAAVAAAGIYFLTRK